MWIIEKQVSKGDYVYGVCKNHPKSSRYGYVLMHRLIAENALGRILKDDEIVHHKNGNKRGVQHQAVKPLAYGSRAPKRLCRNPMQFSPPDGSTRRDTINHSEVHSMKKRSGTDYMNKEPDDDNGGGEEEIALV